MQITETHIYRFSIPMEPFTIATGTMDYAQNVFIRIYTDTGIYGVGECSAFPMIVGETQDTCLALAKDFARIWKGKNPLEIEQRMAELDFYIARNSTIKSAFDMALYDIAAKNANLPLYAFLGGKNRLIETDITIGISNKKSMAKKAVSFVKNGATKLKVKLGKDAAEDIERIKMIREAVGAKPKIRIDANQGYSYSDAVFALQNMEPYDLEFCEQPMRSWDDEKLHLLRKETSVKIMADESVYDWHDAERIIKTNACDYINIKLAKSGGIFGAIHIIEIAKENNIPCMLGGMLESRIALTANVHLALAYDQIIFHDLDTCLLGHLTDPCVGGVEYDKYMLKMGTETGLSADADEVFLNKCEQATII